MFRIVEAAGFWRYTVYVTVRCPSVCPSVPSIDSSSGSAATAPQHGAQQQMRAVPGSQPSDEAVQRFADHEYFLRVGGQSWQQKLITL